MNPDVTQRDIVENLRKLSLPSDSGVMVHSSLKSFGHVAGGARAVVEALMEVVTAKGTLMLPSFNHNVIIEPGGAGYYDPLTTPTINGAIPDTFWRMPGVFRSLDPTHAVAAWGKHAQRYTQFHHRTLTMGPQSPLGLLHADDGFGLLLGVDYGANTFHHVVEMTTGAPCLGQRSEAYPVKLPDGRMVTGRTWGWREHSCPITDHTLYQEEMDSRGLHRQVRIGDCLATLFRLCDCYAVVSELLRKGKNGYPPCSHCPIRPRRVEQTVPTDWDPKTQQPLADSEAWTY